MKGSSGKKIETSVGEISRLQQDETKELARRRKGVAEETTKGTRSGTKTDRETLRTKDTRMGIE